MATPIHGPEANDQDLFDRLNREQFERATTCERCGERPPTDIMRYGSYVAVCRQCAAKILAGTW